VECTNRRPAGVGVDVVASGAERGAAGAAQRPVPLRRRRRAPATHAARTDLERRGASVAMETSHKGHPQPFSLYQNVEDSKKLRSNSRGFS